MADKPDARLAGMTRTMRAAAVARSGPGGRTTLAVVLRWETGGGSQTVVRRRRGDPVGASYRALLAALWEARRMGARAVVLGTEEAGIPAQLAGTAPPPPAGAMGVYLQVRALLNAFSAARVETLPPQSPDLVAAECAAATAGAPGRWSYADLPLWAAAAS
jgi:hypothetical protein